MRTWSLVVLSFIGAAIVCAAPFLVPLAPAATNWSSSVLRVADDGGHGSGVHIGKGYILTAAHVVTDKPRMNITTDRGVVVTADVLWANKKSDIALLRAPTMRHVEVSRLVCGPPPKVGAPVEAVGNPYSLEFVHTFGKVAGVTRKMETANHVYVVSMVVLPGMSGGPVFDANQRLVGLVDAVMQAPIGMFGAAPVALGLIIPVSSVCNLLARE